MAIHTDDLPLPKPAPPPGASRRSRGRALAFMIVSLAAGIGAAWMINRHLTQRAEGEAKAATTLVAVAAADIALGTTLREQMISYVAWPTHALPKGAFPRGESLEGRVAAKDFTAGEPLVKSRLAANNSGLGMAAIVPSELRAMAVRVNEVIGVSGFIHPNDLVDVITTMRTEVPGESKQDFRSKIVLQNIKVVAVGQQMVTENDKPVKVPVVTLLVTPDQSERLALASMHGKIQLTLRSRVDGAEVETAGVTPPDLFGDTPREQPPPAAKPGPAPAARRPKREAVAEKKAPTPEVVEVLRGDRYEERKVRVKEGEP